MWPWNLTDDLEKQLAPILCHFKLCAWFCSRQWIPTGVTVWKRSIRSKLMIFFAMWPWNFMNDLDKTIGYLLYATVSFVHHFVAMGELKLELYFRNAEFRSKLFWFFLSRVTLIFDRWPWKTIRRFFYTTLRSVHHFATIIKFKLQFVLGHAQIGAKFVLTSMTFSFDFWPWPFAWTSLLPLVITFETFTMILWQGHYERGLTDRQDRRTDR